MSASIYYRPVVDKETAIVRTYATSFFISCMEKVFGELPFRVGEIDPSAAPDLYKWARCTNWPGALPIEIC